MISLYTNDQEIIEVQLGQQVKNFDLGQLEIFKGLVICSIDRGSVKELKQHTLNPTPASPDTR
jgi:hypothetical protein